MPIQWDAEKMTTGQPDIDEQHREWLRRFNEFEEAALDRQGEEAVRTSLAFFKQYTNVHFALEETRMIQCHCPAAGENQRAHGKFRALLADIEREVEQGGASSVEVVTLKMELEKWLDSHICAVDVKLRGC